MEKHVTRGIKNNNPLNIRCSSSPWKGKVLTNTDGVFEQFIHMDDGFRAAILTIQTYILKHGCNTLRTIIHRWAPPEDGNNSQKYIHDVCRMTGIGGNEPISNYSPKIKTIIYAMAKIESGDGIDEYIDSLNRAFDQFIPQSVYDNHGYRS